MQKRFVLYCVLAAPLALAQVTGTLSGSVEDASGGGVPNATVNILLPTGTTPVLTGKTTSEGLFSFIGVRPGTYDVSVEAKGFATAIQRNVSVDPIRETSLPTIKLEVASTSQTIEVTGATPAAQTANAEVSTTLSTNQIDKLPILDRYVLDLALTQPGALNASPISIANGDDTVINGLRSTYTNVTLDGINVQDNFLRENGVGFTPNLLKVGQVAEMTVETSNANSTVGGGASQINMVSPSGTNQIHGEALWYNRNSAFAANGWFNNQAGTPLPRLNQNIFSGRVGGPIKKDKLFYFGNYEGTFDHEQTFENGTVLTPDARKGIFTYRDSSGAIQKKNLLTLRNASIDPFVRDNILPLIPSTINNFQTGDSSVSLLRNTAGYGFNQRDNSTRQVVTGKIDYNLSTKNAFTGALHLAKERDDRPDASNGFQAAPAVFDDSLTKLISGTWRWNPTPNFTNELRGGANLSPVHFDTTGTLPSFFEANAGVIWTAPVNEFLPQGRNTNTGTIGDTASYARGRHLIRFGGSFQILHIYTYNDAGIVPSYTVGMGTGQNALTGADLPGINSSDLADANTLLASLGGFVNSYSQTFNVTSQKSGFVNGATNARNWRYNNYSGFVQDQWKALSRLTVTLGVRYDYFAPVDEANGLVLMPQLVNNNVLATVASNASLNFAGGNSGRPIYNKDLNNFAPNIGLAWDVFGDGRTALRAGYSINYVDDNNIATVNNSAVTNSGLSTVVGASGLSGTLSNNRPAIPVPTFQVPITESQIYAGNSGNAMGIVDPNLRTPYVQQWNFGIEHDFHNTLFSVRYVGNHGVKELRALDFNQVNINSGGFNQDFLRARSNGFLALTATGVYNPNYNANIAGSQPLTVFPRLVGGGLLNNGTVRTDIEQGQAGTLASLYQTNGLNGPISFFLNPYILGGNVITNYSNSTYNALQIDVRHRYRNGLQFQGNYTYSKALSDSLGDQQSRFEPFLDVNNPTLERARVPYDLTHVFHINGTYELPFGPGHRFLSRGPVLSRIAGGWNVGSIVTWQSGAPYSILSLRGTLNRGGSRAAQATATSNLTGDQLANVVGFYMTGNGPMFINPANINPRDNRGTTQEGQPLFNGQAFLNPNPGGVGNLQRRMFDNPADFVLDANIRKVTRINERNSIELRLEAINALNHPSFFTGANYNGGAPEARFNINSTSFGKVGYTFYDPRRVQLGVHWLF